MAPCERAKTWARMLRGDTRRPRRSPPRMVQPIICRSRTADRCGYYQGCKGLVARSRLPVDKPASACLASRFPFGTEITREGSLRLRHVNVLMSLGFKIYRARYHEHLVRLELGQSELDQYLSMRPYARLYWHNVVLLADCDHRSARIPHRLGQSSRANLG